MLRIGDRRWLIVVVNVVVLFVVLGRAREGWSGAVAGPLGPYVLWAGLVGVGGLVAVLWSDEPESS